MYKNSFLIVRTRKGNTVGAKAFVTKKYAATFPHNYHYDNDMICDEFDIYENVGGEVFVKTYRELESANLTIQNTIRFERETVTEIEIQSDAS